MQRILGGDEGSLDAVKISGVSAGVRWNRTRGPVSCGQQTVRVAVNAFGVPNDLLTSDQEEQEPLRENLLQREPCTEVEIGEEVIEPV